MLAEIVLPAGKDRITIAEIPALFANAIHPALPENTPRQITKLKKYPLTEENSRHWCGEGCQPFPVSLTSDDVAELNRSVWMGLPPLKLPINEPEWQPYRAAFEKKPPKDWTLKEDFLNRVTLNRDNWHNTVEVYLTEVRQAAMRGNLVPRSSATLLPLPAAIGELLLDCFVTLNNLMSFAARFEIGVRVAEAASEPHSTPMVTERTSDAVEPCKAGPVDGGWVMKKAALIARHAHQWPTIERDFQDAPDNKLRSAASAPGHGEWYEAAALNWAGQRGKLTEGRQQGSGNLATVWTGTKHTIQD